MTLILQHNRHSAGRLLWLFARSAAAALVFASAAVAGLYVLRDMRARPASGPPSDGVAVPAGVELLTPLPDAAEFERVVGFAPVVPAALPGGTESAPRLHATQPDVSGVRTGEVRFASSGGGPSILLRETRGLGSASALRGAGAGSFTASLQCGAIAVDAYVYFDPAQPDAQAVADAFVRDLGAQCAP